MEFEFARNKQAASKQAGSYQLPVELDSLVSYNN